MLFYFLSLFANISITIFKENLIILLMEIGRVNKVSPIRPHWLTTMTLKYSSYLLKKVDIELK